MVVLGLFYLEFILLVIWFSWFLNFNFVINCIRCFICKFVYIWRYGCFDCRFISARLDKDVWNIGCWCVCECMVVLGWRWVCVWVWVYGRVIVEVRVSVCEWFFVCEGEYFSNCVFRGSRCLCEGTVFIFEYLCRYCFFRWFVN